ncbi:MAG TPA: GNAT family N-acetyltransferase [Edaphobacter sp.]|nr:GNAT family N-acetyltransferase [Edaphobacter sp.]
MATLTFTTTGLEGAATMSKPAIEIRPYRAGDGVAFRKLNEDWIEKNFGLEDKDRSTLGDPERYILQPGGHIFMATSEGEAVGCCALLFMRPGVYEVAKMTVGEAYRGQGLGRQLLAYTIAQGKALGAESLYLETNEKLSDAIHLYEALGFRHLPPERVVPSPYARANVFMELVF